MVLGENSNVRAIMFDMGNVLIDLDVQRGIDAFIRDAGLITIGEVLDPCHQRGYFGDFEAGRIDDNQFCTECIRRSRPGTTRETISECIHQMLVGIAPEKPLLLNRLKEHCDLCLLTNNNPIAMFYCSRMFADSGIPLDVTFKHLFYSYRMKTMKPSPEFFLKSVEQTGYSPQEIVFVDDSMLNVNAALELGIDARYYKPGSSLEAVLQPKWD